MTKYGYIAKFTMGNTVITIENNGFSSPELAIDNYNYYRVKMINNGYMFNNFNLTENGKTLEK